MCFYILKEIAVYNVIYFMHSTLQSGDTRHVTYSIVYQLKFGYYFYYYGYYGYYIYIYIYYIWLLYKFGYYWGLDVGNLFGVNTRQFSVCSTRTRSLNFYLQTIHAHSQADSLLISTFFLDLRRFGSKLIADMQCYLL